MLLARLLARLVREAKQSAKRGSRTKNVWNDLLTKRGDFFIRKKRGCCIRVATVM